MPSFFCQSAIWTKAQGGHTPSLSNSVRPTTSKSLRLWLTLWDSQHWLSTQQTIVCPLHIVCRPNSFIARPLFVPYISFVANHRPISFLSTPKVLIRMPGFFLWKIQPGLGPGPGALVRAPGPGAPGWIFHEIPRIFSKIFQTYFQTISKNASCL